MKNVICQSKMLCAILSPRSGYTPYRCCQFFVFSMLAPSIAHAHGEEILIPLVAHAFAIIVGVMGILIVPSPKKLRWQLIGGLFVGGVFAWLVTATISVLQNIVFLTVTLGCMPFVGIALTYFYSKSRNR